MKNVEVKFLFEVTKCVCENEDLLYPTVSFFLNLYSVRSYIQVAKLHRRDILKPGSFSGAQWRRETVRRRQIYVGYNYQNSRIQKHVKTQNEFSVS